MRFRAKEHTASSGRRLQGYEVGGRPDLHAHWLSLVLEDVTGQARVFLTNSRVRCATSIVPAAERAARGHIFENRARGSMCHGRFRHRTSAAMPRSEISACSRTRDALPVWLGHRVASNSSLTRLLPFSAGFDCPARTGSPTSLHSQKVGGHRKAFLTSPHSVAPRLRTLNVRARNEQHRHPRGNRTGSWLGHRTHKVLRRL